jgi:hypothetical protein
MKQEDKELLLKDLCARSPYGVKIFVNDNVEILDSVDMLDKVACYDGWCASDIEEVKPYLFPLSSMTEEQLFEVQEILGKNEIEIEDGFLHIVDSDRNTITYLEILALLEWFYKNHFDIYGLIPMGLAIDATGLNIYD